MGINSSLSSDKTFGPFFSSFLPVLIPLPLAHRLSMWRKYSSQTVMMEDLLLEMPGKWCCTCPSVLMRMSSRPCHFLRRSVASLNQDDWWSLFYCACPDICGTDFCSLYWAAPTVKFVALKSITSISSLIFSLLMTIFPKSQSFSSAGPWSYLWSTTTLYNRSLYMTASLQFTKFQLILTYYSYI